jgi:hypothetical protein
MYINFNEGDFMTLAEKLVQEFEKLTEDKKKEVIDFVEFLKSKERRKMEDFMDNIIDDNIEALKELAK